MRAAVAVCGLVLAGPASADCAGEVAGLYRGGALDPFAVPNRVETMQAVWPDGRTDFRVQITHDGPSREIRCTDAGCLLYAGGAVWRSDTPNGPWSGIGGNPHDTDRMARLSRVNEGFAANVTDAQCEDAVLENRPVRLYRFHTRSQPGIASWSEGDYSVWVDAATGWALRIEEANAMRAHAPDPRDFIWITEIEIDRSISISVPEE